MQKLQRGGTGLGERPLLAVHEGRQVRIRCDPNGRDEPKVTNAARYTNDSFRGASIKYIDF